MKRVMEGEQGWPWRRTKTLARFQAPILGLRKGERGEREAEGKESSVIVQAPRIKGGGAASTPVVKRA